MSKYTVEALKKLKEKEYTVEEYRLLIDKIAAEIAKVYKNLEDPVNEEMHLKFLGFDEIEYILLWESDEE